MVKAIFCLFFAVMAVIFNAVQHNETDSPFSWVDHSTIALIEHFEVKPMP
jgi:hypothetical protein